MKGSPALTSPPWAAVLAAAIAVTTLAGSVPPAGAEVMWEDAPVLVINTHLHSAPRVPDDFERQLELRVEAGALDPGERDSIVRALVDRRRRVLDEVARLLAAIERFGHETVILGGDFNATPGSPPFATVAGAGFDPVAQRLRPDMLFATWDPKTNGVNQAIGATAVRGLPTVDDPAVAEMLAAARATPRQIDHLFVSSSIEPLGCELAVTGERDGLFASDHFALLARLKTPAARAAGRGLTRIGGRGHVAARKSGSWIRLVHAAGSQPMFSA